MKSTPDNPEAAGAAGSSLIVLAQNKHKYLDKYNSTPVDKYCVYEIGYFCIQICIGILLNWQDVWTINLLAWLTNP